MSDELDNSAQAALWAMLNAGKEQMGALYRASDGSIARTPTVTTGQGAHVRGVLSIPSGSLAGLFHNHPYQEGERRNRPSEGESFSRDDIAQAQRLGVPSYIQTPSYALKRFDPKTGTTQDVLAEIPIDQIRGKYMADTMQPGTAITGAQRKAMVDAVLAQAQNPGPPGAPPPITPPPRAMDMGGAPRPLPPGANTFGPPMGAPPPTQMTPEQERAAILAQLIRQAAAGGQQK